MNIGHRVADGIRNVISQITPIPKKSQLTSQGTLNPDEFVQAGDHLVFKFPTWQWQTTDPRYRASWLPDEKQFLISRNVPCRARIKDLDKATEFKENIIGDHEWLVTGEVDDEPVQDISLENEFSELRVDPFFKHHDDSSNIENIEDMTEINGLDDYNFFIGNEEEDPAEANSINFSKSTIQTVIKPTRTYDISITYDKYYQTPRVWLFGYDEYGKPLEPSQIFEDVLTRYAFKTVTVDPHPCTRIPTASIHPCKHSYVMKQVARNWESRGLELKPHLAIVILLKFVSGVIPTIDYDFTMDIEMLPDPS